MRRLFIPNRPLLFDRAGLLPLYQFEGGDELLKRYTRLNILLLVGNTTLISMELLHPCKIDLTS